MRCFFLCLLTLLVCGCSCAGKQHKHVVRIGVDAAWYPIDFESQQPYVNGFTEDLLLAISHYSDIEFERVDANWDSLLERMGEKQYDAVLTSLPPYSFHLAKYDFSMNFLDLGPVLIVPVSARHTELSHMKGELVGLLTGDPAALLLQHDSEVISRNYPSIPDLLNAIVHGEIEGALLNRIPAITYIANLYSDKLKIASAPLTDEGLHLIAAKGQQEHLIKAFNHSLDHFKRTKRLQELLQKWNLNGT